MRARMSHLSMLLMILAINLGMAGAASAKSAAGTVILATGESWRLSTEGRTPLSRKASVYAGDHLITAEGSMTLRMQDNAIVNLQPHSKMIIHAYQPATAGEEAAIRFELMQGTVRTRTGKIGEDAHHRYRLDTPFAALGIRGTDYTVNLNGDALSVYVYSGGIRLAPFSDTLGCIQGNLGACSTPESADLSANDNAWLHLQRGDSIERISGTPDFISSMQSPPVFSTGLHDTHGKVLTPTATHEQVLEFVERDDVLPENDQTAPPSTAKPGMDLEGLRDVLMLDPSGDTDGDGLSDEYELANNLNPWLADMDGDGLRDDIDPTPNQANTHLFKVDNRSDAFTESQIRDYLRHTTLKLDAYDPVASHSLYNLQLKLRQTLTLNGWFDLDQQRLWGKTGSIETLLAARYWPEGLLWEALPESFGQLGASAEGIEWLTALRADQVSLWQLEQDRHSIWFTPGSGPAGEGTQQFNTRWVQSLGNPAGHGSMAKIRSFKADANGRFQIEIGTQRFNYNLRGAVGEAGMLFAENDYLSVKGHWQGNTLVVLITEKSSHQQWMFGLQQTGMDDSPLLAQWQTRNTNGVTWGHWADFARLDEDKLAQLSRHGKTLAYNRHYALEVMPANNLPQSGRVQFALSDASAVYTSKDGLRPAEVINPMLQVDFDQKRFVSRFDVTAPGLDNAIAIQGAGSFDDNGQMHSDSHLSNAQLEGGLGPNGDSASLLFERDLDDDGYVSGITHWQ